MPESRDDYVLGVEKPFPWLTIVVWASVAAPIVLLLFAFVYMVVLSCSHSA